MSLNLTELPIDHLRIADLVMNKHNRKPGDVSGLADSMLQYGLMNPILVFGKTVIAGNRRFAAASKLGWATIACRIIPDDTLPEVVDELAAIENLQREDLTVWEEAESLARIEKSSKEKRTLEDLASHLGKSTTWVAQRRAINKAIPELRKMAIKHDWAIAIVEMISRMEPDVQVSIMRELKRYNAESLSANQVRSLLNDYMRVLKSAPWDVKDAELLPKAGACTTCPKRSSAKAALFPEINSDKADTCLDAVCWQAKATALIQVSIEKLTVDKKPPLLLGSTYNMEAGIRKLAEKHGGVRSRYEFEESNTPKSGYSPAICVSDRDVGKTIYVRSHERSSSGSKKKREIDQETGKPKPKPMKERQTSLLQKRKCRAAELWIEALDKVKIGFSTAVFVASVLGSDKRESFRNGLTWKDIDKLSFKDEDIRQRLVASVLPILKQRCGRYGPIDQNADDLWQEIGGQAGILNAESQLKQCWIAACENVPLPKSMERAGVKDNTAMPK